MEYMKMVLRSINITSGRGNNSSSSNGSGRSTGGDNGGGGGVDGMDLNPLPRTEIQQYYHMLTKISTTSLPHHQQQQQHTPSKLTIITASELMGSKEGESLVALMRQND